MDRGAIAIFWLGPAWEKRNGSVAGRKHMGSTAADSDPFGDGRGGEDHTPDRLWAHASLHPKGKWGRLDVHIRRRLPSELPLPTEGLHIQRSGLRSRRPV